MWAGYGGGHGGDARLYVNQLGFEVFPGEGWRTNGGEPRRRNPVVSLAGRGGPRILMLFALVEYQERVLEIEVVSVGLSWKRSGSGEWPEVEVRMRVSIGLTKQSSGAPMVANRSQRNFRSASGMQVETSST